jgi:hypothetical protein
LDRANKSEKLAMQAELDAAKTRAEEATNKAAEAKESADIIAHQHAQRHIQPGLRKVVVTSLSKNAGQRFRVACRMGEPESQVFAADIIQALKSAGWILDESPVSYPATVFGVGHIVTGINLMTSDKSTAETTQAATNLSSQFEISMRQPRAEIPNDMLVILIPTRAPHPAVIKRIAADRLRPGPFGSDILLMGMSLNKYSGQTVSVYSPFFDEEAERLSVELFAAFKAAQWNVISEPAAHQEYIVPHDNLVIGISDVDAATNNLPLAAVELLNRLKDIRVINRSADLHVFQGMPTGEICIRTGLSPFTLADTI